MLVLCLVFIFDTKILHFVTQYARMDGGFLLHLCIYVCTILFMLFLRYTIVNGRCLRRARHHEVIAFIVETWKGVAEPESTSDPDPDATVTRTPITKKLRLKLPNFEVFIVFLIICTPIKILRE